MKLRYKRLPTKEFFSIYSKVPRLCIDALIKGPRGIVLAKRDIEPWKGMWHIPGGTVMIGEKLESAVTRIVLGETGLKVRIKKSIGVIEYIILHKGKRFHAVSMVFLVSPVGGALHGSRAGKEIQYFKHIPHRIIKEQKKFLDRLKRK